MVYNRMERLWGLEVDLRLVYVITATFGGVDFAGKLAINDGAMDVTAWFSYTQTQGSNQLGVANSCSNAATI